MAKIKFNPEYKGKHLGKLKIHDANKRAKNPIFLYSPRNSDTPYAYEFLRQTVNVHEHSLRDFELNGLYITKHFTEAYSTPGMGLYTIGQSVRFRVVPDGKTYDLSVFAFFMNYMLLSLPVLHGCDLSDWKPWVPASWTSKGWASQVDRMCYLCRSRGNIRSIGECIEIIKYVINVWCTDAGTRMGMSISNNEFIEVMKRDNDSRESISCSFDIPDNITPSELEDMTTARTHKLLATISDQSDLSISSYAKAGLFNVTQFREYAVHIVHKPDLSGNTVPYTHNTNMLMGTSDIRASAVDSYGGLKAEIAKLNVADAGKLERSLTILMGNVRSVDTEYYCDSKHFRTRYIGTAGDLSRLNGRVICLNPNDGADEYWVIDPEVDVNLIGTTVYMKTPISCTHPKRDDGTICAACYGLNQANLNCDVHIGKLAALTSADDMEQKLLSAKHALDTDTTDVSFDDSFYEFFDLGNSQISMSAVMADESADDTERFNSLYFEFYPKTMKKNHDGESRHLDRHFEEIVIYDKIADSRTVIREASGTLLFLSSDFNEYFLEAMHNNGDADLIHIPFSSVIESGKVVCDVIFEFAFKNRELASAIMQIERILGKNDSINAFSDFDECLDSLIPLFEMGGVQLPDYPTEMLIGEMIFTEDGNKVDWNNPHPEYRFCSIDKSIKNGKSAISSVLYTDASAQLSGASRTYEKTGVSVYDWNLLDTAKK